MDFLGVHFGARRLRLLVLAWQSAEMAEMASTRALLLTIYTAGNHSKTTLLSLEEESVIPRSLPFPKIRKGKKKSLLKAPFTYRPHPHSYPQYKAFVPRLSKNGPKICKLDSLENKILETS